jgi:hypothetical protein
MKSINSLAALVILILLSGQKVTAQTPFPDMEGQLLTDKKLNLPANVKGKKTLIGLAYSKKSDEDLRGWFSPAYTTFISPPKSSLFPVDHYDVNIYFVAMLRGVAGAASGKITKKMQEGIDVKLHPYVMIFDGGISEYKDVLNFGDKDKPYFYILDEEGNIIHSTSGEFTDEKMEEITNMLDVE